MKVTDFITGQVEYDNDGQYFWIKDLNGKIQMLAELRGYGAIQNLKKGKGAIDKLTVNEANDFQDMVGRWVAEAINEKLERESASKKSDDLSEFVCVECHNEGGTFGQFGWQNCSRGCQIP